MKGAGKVWRYYTCSVPKENQELKCYGKGGKRTEKDGQISPLRYLAKEIQGAESQ